MDYPNRQQFIAAFGDVGTFSGAVVVDPEDPDAYRVPDLFCGKSWTEVPYDHLRLLQSSLPCFTTEALRHFLPAYVFEAMTDLNGEDLDYTVLRFVAGDDSALLDLGFTHEQLTLLLDAIEYIHAHSREQFDGLEESLQNHRRQAEELANHHRALAQAKDAARCEVKHLD